jgi:predicted porin
LDAGWVGGNTTAAGAASVAKVTQSSFGDSAQSTSRLGFRGTEDLGGGLAAFFTIETAVAVNGSTGVFPTSGTGNRQAFVGLRKNGIGQASFGMQYTTIHMAAAATDPGQLNNMMGNVIYDKAAGITTKPSANSGMSDNSSYTVRTSNMLAVQSAPMMGITGNAFYTLNNTNSNRATTTTTAGAYTGGNNNQTGWGIGANYAGLKNLLVTANYQSFKSVNPYGALSYTAGATTGGVFVSTATAGATAINGVGASAAFGSNVTDNQQYYAATYDFGILKAYAQYVSRSATSTFDSASYAKRSAQQIGVRGNITKTIEAWASGGTGKVNPYGATGQYANFTGYQLGTNYWLSKRTNLYGIFGSQVTSNKPASTGTNPISYNANNYAVGVRHTF